VSKHDFHYQPLDPPAIFWLLNSSSDFALDTHSPHRPHIKPAHDGDSIPQEIAMPFTPLHMGPGLAIKGLIPNHFSFSIFALANVAMDIEPLYRMWRIEAPMLGFSHTLAGAFFIAAGSVLLGRKMLAAGWRLHEKLAGEEEEQCHVTLIQAWLGALFGTGSHLLLDAVMHADMRPFAPITGANPLLMHEWVLPMHLACVLGGMLGFALLLLRAACQRSTV
jgi:hypothetical protein